MGSRAVDLVISDMAGVGIADAARIQHVCELAMEFSCAHLKPNGVLIVKAFHGSGFSQIVQSFKQRFAGGRAQAEGVPGQVLGNLSGRP